MHKLIGYWAPAVAIGLLTQVQGFCADPPKVPEKVDKALKARVNEFFQYHVDGSYRKAIEMVAADTQDEYFASGKMHLKSFTLDSIKYDDKFDKAVVTTTVVRDWEIRMQMNTVTVPMVTTWKLEKGKWVWYHKKDGQEWLTPMGPSDLAAIKRNADGSLSLPKLTQENVLAAGQQIMKQSGPDKGDVRFEAGKPGSDKVVFRNGVSGSIRLELLSMPMPPGLTYKFDKTTLNAGEVATLSFDYVPQEGKEMPAQTNVMFDLVPFNATYTIVVHFAQPVQAQ
jgi:hypothetical protein